MKTKTILLTIIITFLFAILIPLVAPAAYFIAVPHKVQNELGNPSLLVDHGYKGTTFLYTANETLAMGQVVFIASNGTAALADADASTTVPGVAIALGAASAGSTLTCLLEGVMRDDSWLTLTTGGYIYVSTTSGNITQTAPSGSGDQVQQIGIAIGTKIIKLQPDSTIIELE